MFADAHFHADDLFAHDKNFTEAYAALGVRGIASCHDKAGLETTLGLMEDGGEGTFGISFGLHPQWPYMDEAPTLEKLAGSGEILAVGEFGFDFFGDRPLCVRNPENENRQTDVFEFQLDLAERHSLPAILHFRRANDLLFRYAKRLSALPAVILHSWGGPLNEALDFLARCRRAYFSFGTGLLNGNKKSEACAAGLPAGNLLTETDAPFQPPRIRPLPEAPLRRMPLEREYSCHADLPKICGRIAELRSEHEENIIERIYRNLREASGNAL